MSLEAQVARAAYLFRDTPRQMVYYERLQSELGQLSRLGLVDPFKGPEVGATIDLAEKVNDLGAGKLPGATRIGSLRYWNYPYKRWGYPEGTPEEWINVAENLAPDERKAINSAVSHLYWGNDIYRDHPKFVTDYGHYPREIPNPNFRVPQPLSHFRSLELSEKIQLRRMSLNRAIFLDIAFQEKSE